MKNLKSFLTLALFSFLMISCASTSNLKTLSNGKQIDTRLLGNWTGTETGQQIEGATKSWDLMRLDDGKYIIDFDMDGQKHRESGTWWIEDGKYYEKHISDNKVDIYTYEILNKNQVKYKMVKTDLTFDSPNYEFIDTRKKE